MKIRHAVALATLLSFGGLASTAVLADDTKKTEDPVMAMCTEKAKKKYKTEKSQKKYVSKCMKKEAKKAAKK